MIMKKTNNTDFLLAENFSFHQMMPFISEGVKSEWKLEHLKIFSEEVLFNNTGNNAELIIILSGSGGISIDGSSSIVKAGDLIHFPKNIIRSIANVNSEEVLHAILITIC